MRRTFAVHDHSESGRAELEASPTRVEEAAAMLAAITDLPRAMASLERRVVELAALVHNMDTRLPSKMLRVREAAEALGCSVPTVRRKIRAGELPSLRVGRSVRVDLSKLGALDASQVATLVERARSGTG
jgi:excisionase family DNA binding protein